MHIDYRRQHGTVRQIQTIDGSTGKYAKYRLQTVARDSTRNIDCRRQHGRDSTQNIDYRRQHGTVRQTNLLLVELYIYLPLKDPSPCIRSWKDGKWIDREMIDDRTIDEKIYRQKDRQVQMERQKDGKTSSLIDLKDKQVDGQKDLQ